MILEPYLSGVLAEASTSRASAAIKSIPWGAEAGILLFSIIGLGFAYCFWHEFGPEKWYRQGSSRATNAFWARNSRVMLPAGVASASFFVAINSDFAFHVIHNPFLRWPFFVISALAFISIGVSMLLNFSIYFFSKPQRFIPPPFRDDGTFSQRRFPRGPSL